MDRIPEHAIQGKLAEWFATPHSGIYKRVCEGCGETFYTQYHNKKFCRYGCGVQAWRQRAQDRRAEARKIACAACGERFEGARSDARYCSPKCRQAAYRSRVIR